MTNLINNGLPVEKDQRSVSIDESIKRIINELKYLSS